MPCAAVHQELFVELLDNPYSKAVARNVLFVAGFYVTTRGYQWSRVVYYTLGRDLTALYRLLKTKFQLRQFRLANATVGKVFQELVRKHPNKVIFYHDDQEWTFQRLDNFSNQVANLMLESGLGRGDDVSLFMESKPEYVGIWLGVSKAGAVTALINTNQKMDALLHSIESVNSKALIFGSELDEAVRAILPKLKEKSNLVVLRYEAGAKTDFSGAKDMRFMLDKSSNQTPSSLAEGNFGDRLLYIYTSGTTGLPKAVIVKHSRYLFFGAGVKNLIGLGNEETIYTSVPLYHMAGGVIGTNLCLVHGNSMAIRHKFSASRFWNECVKYRCTVAQYVGELCRYLLSQPVTPAEKLHQVSVIFGNGVRPNIWSEFKNRFRIKHIAEFYGSSEGNANVVNINNREGSCGFISQIFPYWISDFFYPVSLIKVDKDTGLPVRGSSGLCVRCPPNDFGEFVGRIFENDPTRAFDGYSNSEATSKKIIRDVFKKGDAYFASGDLLFLDEFGYLYFKDRTGDTFRWKGENVSTTELEEIISKLLDLADCVVYGVEIPGCEGRAGMVTILREANRSLDLASLLKQLQSRLPGYAIPVFVRLTKQMEVTGTLKLPKVNLQKEGFNPDIIQDPLYVLNSTRSEYVRLERSLYEDIINGQIKF